MAWFTAHDVGRGSAIAHETGSANLASATIAKLVGRGSTYEDSFAFHVGNEGC